MGEPALDQENAMSFAVFRPGFVVAMLAAMAVWGCYCALAGQKLVTENLFE